MHLHWQVCQPGALKTFKKLNAKLWTLLTCKGSSLPRRLTVYILFYMGITCTTWVLLHLRQSLSYHFSHVWTCLPYATNHKLPLQSFRQRLGWRWSWHSQCPGIFPMSGFPTSLSHMWSRIRIAQCSQLHPPHVVAAATHIQHAYAPTPLTSPPSWSERQSLAEDTLCQTYYASNTPNI